MQRARGGEQPRQLRVPEAFVVELMPVHLLKARQELGPYNPFRVPVHQRFDLRLDRGRHLERPAHLGVGGIAVGTGWRWGGGDGVRPEGGRSLSGDHQGRAVPLHHAQHLGGFDNASEIVKRHILPGPVHKPLGRVEPSLHREVRLVQLEEQFRKLVDVDTVAVLEHQLLESGLQQRGHLRRAVVGVRLRGLNGLFEVPGGRGGRTCRRLQDRGPRGSLCHEGEAAISLHGNRVVLRHDVVAGRVFRRNPRIREDGLGGETQVA
mmetsp:Transcript_22119/g.42209  ORF Transcript_22119/g.42209 Transcript_22119/m.42209 type:complete len:264 (+) Transcript_22119:1123-1914(+)